MRQVEVTPAQIMRRTEHQTSGAAPFIRKIRNPSDSEARMKPVHVDLLPSYLKGRHGIRHTGTS